MKPIERVTTHYREVRGQLTQIAVPEWTRDDEREVFSIYFKPINLVERDPIFRLASEKTLESLAETIIIRARNADGSKMFDPSDKWELMNRGDSDVISRIVREMNEGSPIPTVEEMEKKSDRTSDTETSSSSPSDSG